MHNGHARQGGSLTALASGLAGALVLTAVHETARKQVSTAPRMDVLGMQAIARGLRALTLEPPGSKPLHDMALAGDLVSNALYYSMVARGKPAGALCRGAMLGITAGLGALTLPGPMGLDSRASNRTVPTQFMTLGWYLLGGLAAGMTYQFLAQATRR